MTEKLRPDALVAKNASDFDAMTEAIETALKKIEGDRRLKPIQATLAKLANCTRGTLNNRQWPLVRLQEIKTARKKELGAKRPPESTESAAKLESEMDELKRLLQLSRTENARLHDKNEELAKALQQSKDLLAEVARHTRNSRQDATPSKPRSSAVKVVPFREKAVTKSEQEPGPSRP